MRDVQQLVGRYRQWRIKNLSILRFRRGGIVERRRQAARQTSRKQPANAKERSRFAAYADKETPSVDLDPLL